MSKKISKPVAIGESGDTHFVLSRYIQPVKPDEGDPYHLHDLKVKRPVAGDIIYRIDSLTIEEVEVLGRTLLCACGYEFNDGEDDVDVHEPIEVDEP